MKKRILFISECSYFSTGFGKYAYQILSRLKQDRNYHVAELAFNAVVNNQEDDIIPWRLYCNSVIKEDNRYKNLVSNRNNKFGAWRFEEIVLDFKPDIVISIADPWMHAYIERSPLRPYFKLVLMPTIDSLPYRHSWYHQIKRADAVLTYSKWAYDELKALKEDIKLFAPAYAGVDFDIYKPENKQIVKSEFGIDPNTIIIGAVMANQPRKLFGDLFQSFYYIKNQHPDKKIKLLCKSRISLPNQRFHTAHWNIPKIIKDYNIQNDVLFAYKCAKCKTVDISLFKGEKKYCEKCNGIYFTLTESWSEPEMAKLYNSMDIYLQLVSAGGFEIPIIEAAACGAQTFAMNFACMRDFPSIIGTIPIEPAKIVRDPSTDAERCVTDNNVVANIVSDYIEAGMNPNVNYEQMKKTYNWDTVCNVWKQAFDTLVIEDKWEEIPQPIGQIKFKGVPSLFDLYYIFTEVLGNTDDVAFFETIQFKEIKEIVSIIEKLIKNKNSCREILIRPDLLPDYDYLKYAKLKEKLRQ